MALHPVWALPGFYCNPARHSASYLHQNESRLLRYPGYNFGARIEKLLKLSHMVGYGTR